MVTRTKSRNLARGLIAGAALTMAMPAGVGAQVRAQPGTSGIETRNADRLTRLENAVRDLQGALYSVEPGQPRSVSPPSYGEASDASSVVRMQQLEQQVAELTGRIEELTFRLASQQRQIDTVLEVLGDGAGPREGGEVALGATGTQGALPPTASRQDTTPSDGPADLRGDAPVARPLTVVLPDDPDAAYDLAYEALLAGDYDRAEAAFEAYAEDFPEGVRTPEAKYLLGEIYLATGAYAEAATQFLDHVRSYPDDPRAPEAYLKLGTSFARLDKVDEACKVFAAGTSKFPDASQSVKARVAAEQRKAGCPA